MPITDHAHRMLLAVLLLSTLMFLYMGGRIIAPAMAGHFIATIPI